MSGYCHSLEQDPGVCDGHNLITGTHILPASPPPPPPPPPLVVEQVCY